MRLRLSVCRHKLPPADFLWAVPDDKAHESFTIAQLLEQVNDIIPLENPHWGLEDYAVEIASFEALHFQKVKDVLKDEDHVCIRHLTQSELRARHVAGRDQINANGQHLIDGIPFGKSYLPLRRPYRPPINIPPLRSPVADTTAEDTFPGLLEHASHFQDSVGENENDAEYTEEPPARKRRRVNSVKSDKSDKSVRFQEEHPPAALPSDEDTEEEYQADSDDDMSSSSSSISDSSSDDPSSTASEKIDVKMADTRSTDSSVSSTSESELSSSDSDSLSISSSEVSSGSGSSSSGSDSSSSDDDSSGSDSKPEEIMTKSCRVTNTGSNTLNETAINSKGQPQKQNSAPGEGLARTKARNQRRRFGRMKRAMAQEQLAKDQSHCRVPESQTLESATLEVDVQAATTEKAIEVARRNATEPKADDAAEATQESTTEVVATPPTKRKRVDLGSFRRLTMGSLGVRTPRNKEEEEKLREKMSADASARGKKKHWAKNAIPAQDEEPEDLEDEDAWKSRIQLKAFEVLDDSIGQLSTPPFPFQQRWDPQQQYESKNTNKKKRKRKSQTYDEQEEYYGDEYGIDGNEGWGQLNYDEEVGDDAAQTQLLQETEDARTILGALPKDEDLPNPPSDVTTLPKLAAGDLLPGATIVYKEMEVSESTGWQPVVSDYRTAKVLEIEDDAAYLKLAVRDIPQKPPRTKAGEKGGKYDGKTFDITEDEEDPSKRWVEFVNIGEMWLLQPAPEKMTEDIGMNDAQAAGTGGEKSGEGMMDIHSSDAIDEGSTAET